jgi:hypothetical protein
MAELTMFFRTSSISSWGSCRRSWLERCSDWKVHEKTELQQGQGRHERQRRVFVEEDQNCGLSILNMPLDPLSIELYSSEDSQAPLI